MDVIGQWVSTSKEDDWLENKKETQVPSEDWKWGNNNNNKKDRDREVEVNEESRKR